MRRQLSRSDTQMPAMVATRPKRRSMPTTSEETTRLIGREMPDGLVALGHAQQRDEEHEREPGGEVAAQHEPEHQEEEQQPEGQQRRVGRQAHDEREPGAQADQRVEEAGGGRRVTSRPSRTGTRLSRSPASVSSTPHAAP